MNKDKFINIYIAVPEEVSDYAVAFLSDFNFTGIVQNFDELVVTFNINQWNDTVKTDLIDSISHLSDAIKITKTDSFEDMNWNEEWEKNIEPIIVSDEIVITPSWKSKDFNNRLKIIIDPKMSFGTGHHATTRLVCRLLEQINITNQYWIDAGTGTGVLAILAAKMGAKVFAFDNYNWSVENSIENVIINHCEDLVEVVEADIENMELPKADGILANLFINLVVPSLPHFFNSLKDKKGILLVSGILVYHKDEVITEAEKVGFELIESLFEDEWIAMKFIVK